MMMHINPLYTVAQICAVACVIALIIGICLMDWEMVFLQFRSRQYRKQYEKQRQQYDWIDVDKWEESK
jgi:hypothetical protein